MKKAILISLLLSVSLSGCAFSDFFRNREVEPVGTNTRVVVDPKLLQSCDTLPPLKTKADFEDVAENHITIIGLYGKCSAKQDDSIKTIRKLANIEEKK